MVVNESDGPSGAFTVTDLSRFFEIGFWVMGEGSDWRGQIAEEVVMIRCAPGVVLMGGPSSMTPGLCLHH